MRLGLSVDDGGLCYGAFGEINFKLTKLHRRSIEKDLWGNDVVEGEKVWDVVNRGGEKARKEEVEVNSRARSARLRVAKRGKRLE